MKNSLVKGVLVVIVLAAIVFAVYSVKIAPLYSPDTSVTTPVAGDTGTGDPGTTLGLPCGCTPAPTTPAADTRYKYEYRSAGCPATVANKPECGGDCTWSLYRYDNNR